MLDQMRARITAGITAVLAEMGVETPSVSLEVPPRRELGDLAWAGALNLARELRRAPRAIAEEVADRLGREMPDLTVAVEGPGFVNVRLNRGEMLAALLARGMAPEQPAAAGAKVVVEHTNINPNKAAHIGHLRNAVLGDTLVRCLRWLGHPVEVQNYIDDTGVQVADAVVGLLYLPEERLLPVAAAVWPEVAGAPRGARKRVLEALAGRASAGALVTADLHDPDFDDLCWELYPHVTRRYEEVPEFAAHRSEVLHAVEGGCAACPSIDEAVRHLTAATANGIGTDLDAAAVARLAVTVAEANLMCHLITMGRLGVTYDLVPHESDILHRGFWRRAFELLQEAGAIRLETAGKNSGCWVMSLADSPEFAGMADADKILVRSNGTVTYTGKDIAYQLWKLGLLRDADGTAHDFGYRPFTRWCQDSPAAPVVYGGEGTALHRSTSDPDERPEHGEFGAGERIYNVIDVRQSYPQKVVREAIRVLGFAQGAENSIHFAYEMVALTPGAVRRLEATQGLEFGLSQEDLARPFVEMSGRKGIGVKADALLATLLDEAAGAIETRRGGDHPLGVEPLLERARAIAVGALRYQMARQGRNRVLAFDFDEALAFEGDTGPYLQYSAVRARKIFDKLAERGLAGDPAQDTALAASLSIPDDLWELVLACARTPEMVTKAVSSLEFSLLAGHARDMAQQFHKLYHEHPVVHAPDESARALRRGVFRLFADTISEILERLLGIPVPAEM